jgi:hypothetical protein
MALQWPAKDPDEVLDYTIDWTDRLSSETITLSTWTITCEDEDSPDLTEDSNAISTVYTVIWLSGGTLGLTYLLTNHITTSAGREMDQTVKLKLKTK